MLDPEVETQPWDEQLVLDDASFQEQLAYVLDRSPFYREKLAGATDVGLAHIAELPLTDKQELKATCTPMNPIGAHLCVQPCELVRIYSTSGTTGAPSYVPLTAEDLENWVTASARSYAASGISAGQSIVSTYNAGPFVAGAALASFERIGLCHVPVGTGNSERLLQAVEQLQPDAVVLTPSYAAYLAERNPELPASSVKRVLVAGEPGGGEPAFRAKLEAGWGAKVMEAMGVGDIGVSLFGECEEQEGMHIGARGFVHVELIDPEMGAPIELDDGARGELVLTTCGTAPRRCCGSVRATTSSSGQAPASADAPPRACAASGEPTTCSSSAASTSFPRPSVRWWARSPRRSAATSSSGRRRRA